MAFRARPMRNESVQAWVLAKLVDEGLEAPPTGANRDAMNEFSRAVSKDAGYKYQAGGEHMCLDPSDINAGAVGERRTLMHASHVGRGEDHVTVPGLNDTDVYCRTSFAAERLVSDTLGC